MVALFEFVQTYFYSFLLGVVVLLIGLGSGILMRKLSERILKEIHFNKRLAQWGFNVEAEKSISTIISYAIYLFSIGLFLDRLGIRSAVLYIVVGIILLLTILTLLVVLKDMLPNFIGWIYLQKKGGMKKNQMVIINEISGKVQHMGVLETEIKTSRGDTLCVPNILFMSKKDQIRKK